MSRSDLRRRLAALRRRVGRRGLFLLFLAMLDGTLGYFLLNPPPHSPVQPYPVLPAEGWAIWWLATAAACAAGAFTRADRVAYGLAALAKAGWGLRYAWLWHLGVLYAWVSVMIWLAFAGIVLIVASWPEEALPPRAPP